MHSIDNIKTPSTSLVDSFGRHISYVRISVTDRCNLRCIYCMAEDMTFVPRRDILDLEEILTIAKSLSALGVSKFRLTGGEPLVRNNIMWLIERLGTLDGVNTLALTTNGVLLPAYAPALRKHGVNRLNISLDSLQSERFRQITRFGKLNEVLAGISAAKDAGIATIRLNTVILKGYNDDEVTDLVDFACDMQIDIAFIEEMPLGDVGRNRQSESVSSDQLIQQLQGRYQLSPSAITTGGPARYYHLANRCTKVGFISPHSHNFCGDCNRVRITAEGRLLLCLGNEHSVDLRKVLRQDQLTMSSTTNQATQQVHALQQIIMNAMDKKPERHYFYQDDAPQILRFMNTTGG